MSNFKSEYAEALLKAHQPNQRAYLIAEIGLEPCEASVLLIDEAYKELVSLGHVEEIANQTIMPCSGCVPKHPFRLTAAGQRAKDNA